MEENEDGIGMTGTSSGVRVVKRSKVNHVILMGKKHSSPDRYGSSGNLAKTRSDASSFGFPEDMRISKLLNRLCAERSVDGALDLCAKLKGVIVDPTNSNYIRRSFDSILESCLTVLLDGPEECQSHMVEILAKVGIVMRADFLQFRSGVLKSFKSHKNLRGTMMRVLQRTLELMREHEIDISNQMPKLLDTLKDLLEKTDNVEVFLSVSSIIDTVAGHYPAQFRLYFTDIVDILVGWHLETEQSLKVKHHCGKILENFRPFWLRDMKFTERLLDQILEDIVLNSEELTKESAAAEDKQSVVFASFVGAFNTILKCIDVTREESISAIGEEFLHDGFAKILSVAKVAILESPGEEDVILTINENIALFFECNSAKFDVSKEEIQCLIEIQLERIEEYSPGQLLSLIFVVVGFVRSMKTKVPMEFVEMLLEDTNLLRERFSRDGRIREALVKLWQEIVDVKNVAILEKVYSHIISELETAMEVLKSESGDCLMTTERGKYLVIFHLNSLARLAASSTSIIALYALRPSLLEMLTTNLAVTDEIWRQYPLVHHAVVGLLVAHCTNNGNFISSSGLLKAKVSRIINKMSPEDTSESPTSDNFEMILSTMDVLLGQTEIPRHALNLLLDWCHQLVLQASAHSEALKDNITFSGILQSIIEMPTEKTDAEVVLKCAMILNDLLEKFTTVDHGIFPGLAEVCCIEMCSTNSQIREIYSNIFGKIPLNVSLRQVNEFTGMARKWNLHIREMQQWHKNQAIVSEIWPHHFRKFLEDITFSNSMEFCDNLLREMLKSAWTVKQSGDEYQEAALSDIRCLVSWIQWEAAQFCVANKLRTPFGKPQETFLRIEAIVKEDARILDLKESSTVDGIETVMANQRHARILLGFMEALEKAIYSATEGTAFALPGPEKPARSFFHLNSITCNEWFNRIRTAVDLVALHCMEPEMVIRYSETTIRNLLETNRVAEPLFEHTLMSLAWALLRNGESDSLSGLYTWTKKITGKRLMWVKMAAEQAAGHRETAASGYAEILEADQKLDLHIREFIADQLVQCLLWSGQWLKLADFLEAEEARAIPRATIPLINVTSDQVRCMIAYDEDESNVEDCLSNWEVLSEDTEFSNNFSYHHIISLAENTIACVFPLETMLSPALVKMCSKILQNGLQEALRTRSQEHLNNLTVLNHICHKIAKEEYSVDSLSVDKTFGSLTLMRILFWAELLCGSSKKVDDLNAMLRLDMVSMARKEGSLQLCKRELEKYYSRSNCFTSLSPDKTSLVDACEALMHQTTLETPSLWSVNLGRAVYETSKWLYCFPEKREFAVQFTAATALGIRSHLASQNDSEISERGSRIFLTISEWLLPEDEKHLVDKSPLGRLLQELPDVKPCADYASNNLVPAVDLATGKLIAAAVKQCPDLAKAWNAFGGWCYKWGRKMVENRPSNTLFQSTDIAGIAQAIPEASQEEIKRVVAILSEHQVPMEVDDIEPGDGSSTELLEKHLRKISSLEKISPEQLQVIIGIWRRAHKHVYGYYEMAADAYFKYLQLGTVGKVDDDGTSSTVAATLRLLRLIVKHALGLQEVLEEGLASTPTSPWKVIIPQLFSRLNHHEPYVRRRVSELLCRVAEDSPHIIIFPAVVGAAQGEKSEESNTLSECFYSLLDTLSSQAADTVSQVQLLVRELRRICLLWDEMCLVTMSQTYVDSSKKFTELDKKITQDGVTDANYGKFAEQYHQLMKPIVVTMDKLKRAVSREPETKHEAAFQERFLKVIVELSDLLKEPMRMETPLMPWHKFKSLCGVFQQRVQKRSNFVLKMSDISPTLSEFRNTVISMPGVENSGKQHIYIRSVENMVQILNTKTKPKKLAFCGSDGNKYTYLFKGLEDLHLDERIMQFLSIANSMMTRTIDCNGNVSSYRARHYSVIPLGPQSGLISWVDGVLPIFSVYKKWQQREASKPRKDKEISPILRPSELFFSKLTPKLLEKGMKVTDARSSWPLEVLRDVLTELSMETPRDLLSREFWCTSTTAAEWRQIVRNYSLSLAVMSVIGYIIGLGDRHLDNVLVNLSTGEIVHIDYNVCFEKGKTLRVPEKIPFRMTQNLEKALGVTGIEGTFRLACENVLKALKRGRETLLTLLEAFVYDPLVDWAVGEDDDTTNGYVEAKQTSSGAAQEREMLKLRYEEMTRSWKTNRWATVEVLEALMGHAKPLAKAATSRDAATEKVETLEAHLKLLKTMSECPKERNCGVLTIPGERMQLMKKRTEVFAVLAEIMGNQGNSVAHPRQIVVIPEQRDLDLIMCELDLNEFDGIREIASQDLCKEGSTLCREMNRSYHEELRILRDVFEQMSMYVDLEPFLIDAEIARRSQDICWQCQKLLAENRNAEAGQKAMELWDIGVPCWKFCSSLASHIQTVQQSSYESQRILNFTLAEMQQNYTISDFKQMQSSVQCSFERSILYYIRKSLDSSEENLLLETVEIQQFANFLEGCNETFKTGRQNLSAVMEIVNNIWECSHTFAKEMVLGIIQKIIDDDASVLTMITTVSALQHDNISLEQMISDTEKELSCENHNSGQNIEKHLQESFEQLVCQYRSEEVRTTGQILLVQLYDAFPSIENAFQDILDGVKDSVVLKELEKVDEIAHEKRQIIFTDPETREILVRLWSLRKLQAIIELFTCTLQIACAFRSASPATNNMWEQLFSSHDKYISTFVCQLLKPIIDYSRGLMIVGLLENFSSTWRHDLSKRSSLRGIVDAFADKEWKEKADLRNKDYEVEKSREMQTNQMFYNLQCKYRMPFYTEQIRVNGAKARTLEIIGMAYAWRQNEHECSTVHSRKAFLQKLKSSVDAINAWEISIQKMHQELMVIHEKMKKVIANMTGTSGHSDSLYPGMRMMRKTVVEKFQRLSKIASANYKEILAYEGGIAKQREGEKGFLALVQLLDERQDGLQKKVEKLDKNEKAFLELLPVDREISEEWLEGVKKQCESVLIETRHKLFFLEKDLAARWQLVGQHADKLESVNADFVRVSTEVRGLLKSSLKMEGKHQNATKEYLTKNKHFTTTFDALTENLRRLENPREILQQIESLLQSIDGIFDGPSELKKYHHEAMAEKSEVRVKEAHQNLQKRNAYAVSVWRRIRMKLEGRDPDPARRSTVPEQVEWMIREAMDADNLAVLYEGWTPWV
ncbi:serine/threonine-protein kinase Smg1 isoform X2 [Phlebotomus argentipes]|uniref:serine/threonine-protein kinase Smg1 isoform X2 n=1 Tax=Phlebotomus argentipes TaxID=94469 RepID=UPI00289350F2|nr:serine/threonine-protein kinase Smg1 isoform X2 [Phlebotomus argentipes]